MPHVTFRPLAPTTAPNAPTPAPPILRPSTIISPSPSPLSRSPPPPPPSYITPVFLCPSVSSLAPPPVSPTQFRAAALTTAPARTQRPRRAQQRAQDPLVECGQAETSTRAAQRDELLLVQRNDARTGDQRSQPKQRRNFDRREDVLSSLPSTSASPSTTTTSSSPSMPTSSSTSLPVPVKYERSTDGNWYPAISWSLHGKSKHPTQVTQPPSSPTLTPVSTLSFSSTLQELSSPTSLLSSHSDIAPSEREDNNVLSATTTSSSSTLSVTAPTDITNSLPTGWQPIPEHTKFYDTPVIIVVSIILAVLVTGVMGCVLGRGRRLLQWKKTQKRMREKGEKEEQEDTDEYEEEEECACEGNVCKCDSKRPEWAAPPASAAQEQQQRHLSSLLSSPLAATRTGSGAGATTTAVAVSKLPSHKKDKIWERWRKQAKTGIVSGLRRRKRWRGAAVAAPEAGGGTGSERPRHDSQLHTLHSQPHPPQSRPDSQSHSQTPHSHPPRSPRSSSEVDTPAPTRHDHPSIAIAPLPIPLSRPDSPEWSPDSPRPHVLSPRSQAEETTRQLHPLHPIYLQRYLTPPPPHPQHLPHPPSHTQVPPLSPSLHHHDTQHHPISPPRDLPHSHLHYYSEQTQDPRSPLHPAALTHLTLTPPPPPPLSPPLPPAYRRTTHALRTSPTHDGTPRRREKRTSRQRGSREWSGDGSAEWPIDLEDDYGEEEAGGYAYADRKCAPEFGYGEGEGGGEESSVPMRAHVATDDKAILERMRRGASEPEPETEPGTERSWASQWRAQDGDIEGGNGGTIRVEGHDDDSRGGETSGTNVPMWEDERLEDFEDFDAIEYNERLGCGGCDSCEMVNDTGDLDDADADGYDDTYDMGAHASSSTSSLSGESLQSRNSSLREQSQPGRLGHSHSRHSCRRRHHMHHLHPSPHHDHPAHHHPHYLEHHSQSQHRHLHLPPPPCPPPMRSYSSYEADSSFLAAGSLAFGPPPVENQDGPALVPSAPPVLGSGLGFERAVDSSFPSAAAATAPSFEAPEDSCSFPPAVPSAPPLCDEPDAEPSAPPLDEPALEGRPRRDGGGGEENGKPPMVDENQRIDVIECDCDCVRERHVGRCETMCIGQRSPSSSVPSPIASTSTASSSLSVPSLIPSTSTSSISSVLSSTSSMLMLSLPPPQSSSVGLGLSAESKSQSRFGARTGTGTPVATRSGPGMSSGSGEDGVVGTMGSGVRLEMGKVEMRSGGVGPPGRGSSVTGTGSRGRAETGMGMQVRSRADVNAVLPRYEP